MKDETMVYDVSKLENYMVTEVLYETKCALDEKGYDGINQIVGYLLTGDLSYISSYKDSRNKMRSIDRDKIIEALLKYYLKDVKTK